MRVLILLLLAILITGTGSSLFHIALEVEHLEKKLSTLNKSIEDEKNTLNVLEAEWAYLTRPARIGSLSARLLPELGPAQINQIVDFQDMPHRFEFSNGAEDDPIVKNASETTPQNTKSNLTVKNILQTQRRQSAASTSQKGE